MSHQVSAISEISCKSSSIRLSLQQKQKIAFAALANGSPTELAKEYNTNRMFIHRAKKQAVDAIQKTFSKERDSDDVLFYLPITKAWIRSFILAQLLICHSSYSGVIEILRDLFGYAICKGSISNIVHAAIEKASKINSQKDLSNVKVGAHDEIFQNRDPVLVGVDTRSTYCYLLSLEQSRDSTAWGTHLLDLKEKQNLCPDHTIGDGGKGLRKGQEEAWPGIPCHGDVFHAIKDFTELCCYLENRALGAIVAVDQMEKKMERAKTKQNGNTLSKKLAHAREKCTQTITLYDEVQTLSDWMRKDLLIVVGPDLNTRVELFDFIVKELEAREPLYAHRIKPVRTFLENQKDDLLRFVKQISEHLSQLSKDLKVKPETVRELYETLGIPVSEQCRWEKETCLMNRLGAKFYVLKTEIQNMIKDTVRASSVVENLNSRLRNYFFLRKQLGSEYLQLLQFFLNHRRFMRSEHKERVGKSPAELLTSIKHSHWLELLGMPMFKKAA